LFVLLAAVSGTLAIGYNFSNSHSNNGSKASASATPSPTSTSPSTTPTPPEPSNRSPTELRIFVATSLANVVRKHAQETFERENNVRILINLGGSDTLYQQIACGSPADVYLAADFKWTTKLKTDGLLDNNQYWNFTTNQLIVILPADNPQNITNLLDLARPHTKIVVAAWTVPAGRYTNMTLTNIQKTWSNRSDPTYKGPQWEHYRDRVMNNIVSYEPTVTYVVTKVLMGVCDAGFAYITDVKFQGPKLQYVEIPQSVNTIGTYGIAIIRNTGSRDLSVKYVQFWLSKEGQELLEDFGFGQSAQVLGETR
jgi:molybdate transport system substrate-binding protein